MPDNVQDMEKQKEELAKLTPVSLEQLQGMIPETLMGATRTNFDANAAMGAATASAQYELNDSTSIGLTIIDCAGPGGAGIYSLQYLSLLNIREDNEDEYTKTVDFNGGKAFENCDKTSNDCSFTYFAGGRYLVALEGDNVSVDILKQAADGIKLK